MREWCGCGAAIRARRSDVIHWRNNHRHSSPTPDGFAPTSGGSHVENASWPSIGFIPEPLA